MSDPCTYEARVAEVHAHQCALNMAPRSDSHLTELYATEQLPPDMDASVVARELMATHYLYSFTLYGDLLEAFMRHVATTLRAQYPGLSWASTWEIVRAYGPPALKLMCLSSSGQFIPEHLPHESFAEH